MVDYSLSFGVNSEEYETHIYFTSDENVKQIDDVTIQIGNLKIQTHEPITKIEKYVCEMWIPL